MNKTVLLLTATLLVSSPLTWAAGGGSDDSNGGARPVPDKAMRLVESEQYDRAVDELQAFVKQEKDNPDAWNWLGFSQRHAGDLDGALRSYQQALKLDQQHIGANEYLGELYIMRGEMDKAKSQLKLLSEYCFNCEEYTELETAIQKAGG